MRLFATAVGECAIAWGEQGITGVWLPEPDPELLRQRVQRRRPHALEGAVPPPMVQATIEGVVALLRGEPETLAAAVLDMRGTPPFEQRVWTLARGIRPGHTLTYGEVAQRLGEPGAARAVGRALGHNPFAPVVPCHRVLAAGGRPGGFSAPGGTVTKLRLLQIEAAQLGDGPSLF